MNFIELKPLSAVQLPQVVELDKRCLGGLWTIEGYQRELDSPNSDLLILQRKSPRGTETGTDAVEQANCKTVEGQWSTSTSADIIQAPCHSSVTSNAPPLLALGCLWAILDEAHITILAVDPDHQRQGFGQALLYALLVAAWQRQLEWATLEVRESNQAALSLYRKFGFQEAGRRRGYYQDNGEAALILWRSGLQQANFCETLRLWRRQVSDRLSQSGWSLSTARECDTSLDCFP